MNSFNSKITNRKLNSQKQGGLHGDAADGSSGETGHKDSEGQDITTIDNDPTRTKGGTETYIHTHREGRDNWTQVKHMRTGADNHRQEVKKENTLDTETTK